MSYGLIRNSTKDSDFISTSLKSYPLIRLDHIINTHFIDFKTIRDNLQLIEKCMNAIS